MPRVRVGVVVMQWNCGRRCALRRRAWADEAKNIIIVPTINTALANLHDVVERRVTVIAGPAPSIAEPMAKLQAAAICVAPKGLFEYQKAG
jgi:hypothetical protein